jgi:bla regulator protein blaR1
MVNEVLTILVRLSVVGSVGILLLGLLRVPARRAAGAEAAYWLWLLCPASLIGVLLPRAPPCLCGPETLVSPLLIRGIATPLDFAPSTAVSHLAPTVTLLWAVGAAIALWYFAYCQYALQRSLGRLQRLPDGTYRSLAATQPMVVGAWHPRIVLPGDFETRYSESERTLILAHERAHLDRHDALTNSIAVALLCLFWFNPLMYWAWNRFRFDQELACDATVLRRVRMTRRCYARALAKTQLTAPAAISFGWRRRHPLLDRIAILRRPAPSRTRRWTGYSLALMVTLSGTYVVWAAQPDLHAPILEAKPLIAIRLRWSIDGTAVPTNGHASGRPDRSLRSGDELSLAMPSPAGVIYGLKCVPTIHLNDSLPTATLPSQGPVHAGPQEIMIACEISRAEKVFAKPAVLLTDGQTGVIEVGDPEQNAVVRIELNASTSPSRLKAAGN